MWHETRTTKITTSTDDMSGEENLSIRVLFTLVSSIFKIWIICVYDSTLKFICFLRFGFFYSYYFFITGIIEWIIYLPTTIKQVRFATIFFFSIQIYFTVFIQCVCVYVRSFSSSLLRYSTINTQYESVYVVLSSSSNEFSFIFLQTFL